MKNGEIGAHLAQAVIIDGDFDVKKAEAAIRQLIERHEALRTGFEIADGEIIQFVKNAANFQIEFIKADGKSKEQLIEGFLKPFELGNPPLLHVSAAELGENSYLLFMDFHHIISDGYSCTVFLREFMRLYQNKALSDVKNQYGDYINWWKNYLASQSYKEDEAYWRKKLSGALPLLDLPCDFLRPPVKGIDGDVIKFSINRETTAALKVLAGDLGATLYMAVLGTFTVLLSKLSNQEEILIGTPAAVREDEGFENTIGMCTNTLVLKNNISCNKKFKELIGDIKKICSEAFAHMAYPYEDMIQKLGVKTEVNRNPFFDAMFIYENANERAMKLQNLLFAPYEINTGVSLFDITLEVIEEEKALNISMYFSTELFKRETVKQWGEYYNEIIQEVLLNPDCNISDILKGIEPQPQKIKSADRTCTDADDGIRNNTDAYASYSAERLNGKNPFVCDIESRLAEICKESLGINDVQKSMNFFDMGLRSLSALDLAEKLRKNYELDVNIMDIFKYPTIEELALVIAQRSGQMPETQKNVQKEKSKSREGIAKNGGEDIAIIGMSAKFPGAGNVEEFWDVLREGRETVSFFQAQELTDLGMEKEQIENPDFVRAKGIIDDLEYFDAAFFEYSSKEAEMMDPQIRMFHECAWKALEDSGCNPLEYKGRIGVFAGSAHNQNWTLKIFNEIDDVGGQIEKLALTDKDFLSTRVSYKLNLRGPSINVQTACSTSLVAVHLACRSIINGECDMALAGGVSVMLPQKGGYMYSEGMILPPDGRCRAFDADAAGTLFADGVGIVVLKQLEAAIADGDTIHAVIKGSAVNNDGVSKVGYTAPGIQGQKDVIMAAHRSAGVEPETITYVETHGTGTKIGDTVEFEALKAAFATDKRGYCAIGSLKTNMGHLDAAAGVGGLIKTVLALKNKQIPPSMNFQAPNPDIDFIDSPFYVNTELREWERISGVTMGKSCLPLRAGVSSFGIGGTNAHLILEEAPAVSNEELCQDPPGYNIITLSARTRSDLERATDNLAVFLDRHPEIALEDVAYTLQTGRKHFKYRRTVVSREAKTAAELLRNENIFTGTSRDINEVVFILPDHSCWYENMCRELYYEEPKFSKEMDNCFDELKAITGYEIKEVSPLIGTFIIEYSFAKFLINCGIIPTLYTGDGIGKYVVACLTGLLPLKDAILSAWEWSRTGINPINGIETEVESSKYWFKGLNDGSRAAFVEIGTGLYYRTLLSQQDNGADRDIAVNVIRSEMEEGSDVAFLLEKIGLLWCSGVKVGWKQYYTGRNRRHISLPTYPFRGQSYPVEGYDFKKAAAIQEKTGKLHKESDMDKWFYAPTWKTLRLPAGRILKETEKKTWLVFTDMSGIGSALAEKLREIGHEVLTVKQGTEFEKAEDGLFTINPGKNDDYEALFKELNTAQKVPQGIIHLWNIGSEENLELNLDRSFYSLIYIAQAIGKQCASSKIDIFVLSSNMQAIIGEDVIYPLKSILLGPCKVIPKEYSNLTCRSIDIVPTHEQEELIGQLLCEFSAEVNENIVAYRHNKRFVEDYEPIVLKKTTLMPEKLKENGVYLITGGTGGIGLVLAEYMAQIPNIKLVLTGRSAFPEKDKWEQWSKEHGLNDKVSKIIQKVRVLEQMGAEVLILSAEVSDLNQMQNAVSQVESRFGKINGVIHAAGIPGDGVIQLKTREMVEKVFSPKVKGTLVLDAIFKERNLDFLVIFSSISSVFGELGQVDYVAANSFIDSYARSATLRNNNTFTLGISWDTWIETGMVLKAFSKMKEGMAAFFKEGITCAEGMDCFGRLLQTNESQVVISTKDLKKQMKLISQDINAENVKNLLDSGRKYPRPELSSDYAAPSNETEHRISLIWEDIFRIDKVGVHDNFYELGGDSLIALSLVAELQKHFTVNITDIYNYPSVSALTNKIAYQGDNLKKSIEKAKTKFKVYQQTEKIKNDIERDLEAYRKRNEKYPGIDLSISRNYSDILLTGSTGYLGIYMMLELLEKTSSNIYVIIRAENTEKAVQRLIEKFSFYFDTCIYEKYKERIKVLKGDITKENFGLDSSDYLRLAQTIDCIINSAAKVAHYGKYEEFYEINVGGVEKVIEFARQNKKKDIHHISSKAVGVGNIEGVDNKLYTEYDFNLGQKTDNYYVLTKAKAEEILLEARKNGIKVNIYRLGDAVFDSRTGRFQENIENNFIYLLMRSLLKLKAVPKMKTEIILFDFAFVDYLSKAIVQLLTREALSNEVFHVYNSKDITLKDFVDESEYIGMDIKGMQYGDFLDLIFEKYEDEALRPYIMDFLVHSHILELADITKAVYTCEKTEYLLEKMGFEWTKPSREQLKKMIDYGKGINFF